MKNTILFFIVIFVGNYLMAQNQLVAYEYWFNQNIGAKQIEPIAPAIQHRLSANVDASGLPDGVNVFNIRCRDENGFYSSTLSQLFYKNTGQLALNNKLVSYEFWFNNDYVNKKKQQLTHTPQHSISATIDASELPDGVNVFNIRYRDENGLYTSTLSQLFYKNTSQQALNNKLVSYEYWFNNDDVNKNIEYLTPAAQHSINTNLDAADLPDGVNVLNIRYKDENGVYSTTLSTMFYKFKKQAIDNKITTYRYWFNDDFEQAETVELNPGVSTFALVDDLDITPIPQGKHAIHFQFKDLVGAWSVVSTDSITKAASTVGFLENTYETQILVYPNPTSGRIGVELGQYYPETIVAIYDLGGRLIHQRFFKNTNRLNIDIDGSPGVYLMSLQSSDKKAMVRVVKK